MTSSDAETDSKPIIYYYVNVMCLTDVSVTCFTNDVNVYLIMWDVFGLRECDTYD